MFKKFLKFSSLFALLLGSIIASFSPVISASAADENEVNIYFFHNTQCANCADLEKHLQSLDQTSENIHLIYLTLNDEDEATRTYNETLFNQAVTAFGYEYEVSYPFTIVGGKSFIGSNLTVKSYISKYVEKYLTNGFVDVMAKIMSGEALEASDFDTSALNEFELPLIGTVDVGKVSLFLVALVLGLVDGVNPCAMWVLLLLITLLLPTKDKKKMWILGGSFLLTSALFYFMLMMAWIKTVSLLSAVSIFQIIVGAFALIAGGFQIYQYIKAMKKKEVGCEVTNVEQRRSLTKKAIAVIEQNNLWLAALMMIGLALLVNFIELACSAGLPVLFSQILAINQVNDAMTVFYIGIYVFFFLLDDLIVFTIAVTSFKALAMSNKLTKYSHLIGGIIMLLIGFLMLFFPEILLLNL